MNGQQGKLGEWKCNQIIDKKTVVDWKKSAMWEFELSFTWGKNEAYSPEDNILNRFEKMLQRGRGRVIMYVILEKGEYMQSSTHFFVKSFF